MGVAAGVALPTFHDRDDDRAIVVSSSCVEVRRLIANMFKPEKRYLQEAGLYNT